MKLSRILKRKSELVPGTIVQCKSGRFLAYYEHRTDIIANGENEKDAKSNLRMMYKIIKEHEDKEAGEASLKLPDNFITKRFVEKAGC